MRVIKKLLLILLLTGCVSTLKTSVTGTKTAVLIEGLGSAPTVKNAYNEYLKSLGYTVYNTNHTEKKLIKANLCIGHSFGGGRLMRDDVTCDIVITMDAREWNASKNDSYVTKHKVHYNFYQQSGPRGYPVEGAVNKDMGRVGHMSLPKASFNYVSEILNHKETK